MAIFKPYLSEWLVRRFFDGSLPAIGAIVLVLAILLGTCSARAQEARSGIGAEARAAAPSVDPTKNVLDLVQAAIKRQDDLREAETKFQISSRDAEMKRINELAVQKQLFDLELARVLKSNVDSSALLLSTQLREVKTDLSDRVAKLEQFRWESGGRNSGQGEVVAWIVSSILLLVAVGSLATAVVVASRRRPAPAG